MGALCLILHILWDLGREFPQLPLVHGCFSSKPSTAHPHGFGFLVRKLQDPTSASFFPSCLLSQEHLALFFSGPTSGPDRSQVFVDFVEFTLPTALYCSRLHAHFLFHILLCLREFLKPDAGMFGIWTYQET